MINYIEASLDAVVAHYIGSHSEREDISYSKEVLTIEDEELYDVLFKFFLNHFKEPEYFNFTFSSGEVELNPVFNFVSNIFDDPGCIHEQSVKIARHLYEKSKHPNIKPGELYISYFSNIHIDNEIVDAVGIFKSENKDYFLKLNTNTPEFKLMKDIGTNIGKIDKGCLIFNCERDNGFKICNIDHSNRYKEAIYWREDFLMLKPRKDDYHQTTNYIQATKNFIKDRMAKEFDTDKMDEAAVMSRSFDYFKKQEKFDAVEYEERVFRDGKVVEAFKDYKQEYEGSRATALTDSFDISSYAVNKQSRIFKSIIKLDKNFHIYIHGDKNKILKGVDDEGKKYYMLYYDNED
ncbi:MAG: nucleoid-associated protein [Saprospiraceae bacterium]|nr:nucleoid-associated protein [Saprospiraceae bacterium]